MLEWRDKLFPSCQKQSSGAALYKRYSYKFRKIHRKTPVPEACNVIKKETLAQVLSCEFCEIFKSTFFTEHLWWLLLKSLSNKCHGHLNSFFFISIHNKFVYVKNIIRFYINLPKIYLPTNKYVSKYGYYKIK